MGWVGLLRVQSDVSVWHGRGQRIAGRLVAGPGHAWMGRVTVHKHRDARRIQTALVVWVAGHAEPWVVFTTLPPQVAGLRWYGLRMWIEAGVRDRERLGGPWERTRRTDLMRVARHWLVLAVATIWVLRHSGLLPPGATGTARTYPPISAFQRGRRWRLDRLFGIRSRPPAPLLLPAWPDHATFDLQLTRWTAPPYVPGSAPAPPVNLPL